MKAFYAGSFNPFTVGHLSIARRALEMFEHLIIGIGYNNLKEHSTGAESRINEISKLFEGDARVEVIAYTGLTTQAAKEKGAGVLVRGVRNSIDFEKEKELADINLEVFGMPTVFIPADPKLDYVSSSMVRELRHFGFDTSDYVPTSKSEI